jgi:hypothetical protein
LADPPTQRLPAGRFALAEHGRLLAHRDAPADLPAPPGPGWIPQPGPEYHRILGRLLDTTGVGGNLIPDAMLAALAIEHGVTLYSADTDFGRFTDLRWENPLRR